MLWYENMLENIKDKNIYSHKVLIDKLKTLKPNVADSTYQWALSSLVSSGRLTRTGYDSYALSTNLSKKEYTPNYSAQSLELIKLISEKYPYVKFTVFETILMNDYLNHLIAQNTIFIQVEKESSIYVFRFLQESGFMNVMYKPNTKDFNLYWSKDSIVIIDLVSEAPLRKDNPHTIMLEKMFVDILADKLIASSFSKAEFPDIFKQMQSKFLIDKVRMMRYARRRNKQKEITKYFEGSAIDNVVA